MISMGAPLGVDNVIVPSKVVGPHPAGDTVSAASEKLITSVPAVYVKLTPDAVYLQVSLG